MASTPRVLIYLLRRDLRVHDNPIFHELARLHTQSHKPFTHVLPVYVFPAQQVEVSGFLAQGAGSSPYPEARSQVGKFWRCGPQRATFLAESVWDVKRALEALGSGLEIRVGLLGDVVRSLLAGLKQGGADVAGLWMTAEDAVEERREQRAVQREVQGVGAEFKLWNDEKYFVDDRDIPFAHPRDCPDIFTSFKKMVEPLSEAPRQSLPLPSALPPLPSPIPPQDAPFEIPTSLDATIAALHKPLPASLDLKDPPSMPPNGASTAVPFKGGAAAGHKRLDHLVAASCMTNYKDTRNGLLGPDFSSKLSAWLALGCLTAREVHWALLDFEQGRTPVGAKAKGYGHGENKGTAHMRFELLWRDFFRHTTRKFGPRLFRAAGFRNDTSLKWRYDAGALARWLEGTTGMGLVDAAQRELFLTGYTSNRTRQNVASYLAKHLGLDWRLGAEWYESLLIDYDVHSNWGNWQYAAGVGNDPREGGAGRKFNPVKQAHDYDPQAAYIKAWVVETRQCAPAEAMQCSTVDAARRRELGLEGCIGAEQPLVRIQYGGGRGGGRGGRGGRGGGGGRGRGRGGNARTGFSKGNGMDLIG